MTRLYSCIPRWPLLVMTLCLLVLSIAAPAWYWGRGMVGRTSREVAGPSSADSSAVGYSSTGAAAAGAWSNAASAPVPAGATSGASDGSTAAAMPTVHATLVRRPAARPRARAEAPGLAGDLNSLGDYAVTRQVAEVLPPVAERIVLDPSIAETPPLPAPYEAAITNKVQAETQQEAPPPAAPKSDTAARRDVLRRTEMPMPSSIWPYPIALSDAMQTLKGDELAGPWAEQVIHELEQFKRIDSLGDVDAGLVLQKLKKLAAEGRETAAGVEDPAIRSRWLHQAYAIDRRLAVWEQVFTLASHAPPPATTPSDPNGLIKSLKSVDVRVQELGNAAVWREYLLLTQALEQATPKNGVVRSEQLRTTARRILLRLDAPSLADRQYDFFRAPPFPQLEQELRRWANEPVDLRNLLIDIERYELSLSTVDASRVAGYFQILRWSPDHQVVKLADQVNTHYRNANVRVAIAAELINHMIPDQDPTEEDVNDVILGAQVYGRSVASTRLRVVLFPDRRQWRLGLLANGEAVSDTESYKSGAMFRNEGFANFQARKLVTVDRRGMRIGHSETDAEVQSNLRDMATDFDGVPLLNMLARSIARSQYEENAWQAQAEMKDRVAWKANARFDQEVQTKFAKAEQEFKTKLLKPLQTLDLQPTAVDMETTETRLIVRERLAGREQLGAHTPRPQAPGNSWLSVQVHETAMNNALAHLNLDGKRTDLRRLHREMADRFDRHNVPTPDDLPDDIVIQFAAEDAVRVHCENGRITLVIRIVELSQDRSNTWKNFVVRAHYKPLADQSVANLARDGVIELVGERLSFGDQVKLRGVFSRFLSRNNQIAVVNKQLLANPRLKNLGVNQFVIEDGWVGIAVEPKRRRATARLESDATSPK